MIKLATWNICLGMRNKKDIIYETLKNEKIDICALQEVEIPTDYQHELMSSKDYKIEIKQSSGKARCATVINRNIDYVRRKDLETINNSIVIIDVNVKPMLRILNIYRSFTPQITLHQSQPLKNN